MTSKIKAWHINAIDNCPSTNSELSAQLASKELLVGSVIWTQNQTDGRGRYDRQWVAPKGNLSISIAVPLPDQESLVYQLNLIAGLSVLESLAPFALEQVCLKWPNDILTKGLKVCGILSETALKQNAAILGLGINLNSHTKDFPIALQPKLTTLHDQLERSINVESFVDSLLHHLKNNLNNYYQQGLKPFLPKLMVNLAWKNKRINVQESLLNSYQATVTGIDENGFLVLETDDKESKTLIAGDISLITS